MVKKKYYKFETYRFGDYIYTNIRMKKFILNLKVIENLKMNDNYVLLKLTSDSVLPEMKAGQFAEIHVEKSQTTYLRRPISIYYIEKQYNELWFLIQLVGDGTQSLGLSEPGDIINVILPLGNGFTMPQLPSEKLLLVGGGAGMAPMLFLGKQLWEAGYKPTFLLGMRNKKDLFQLDKFAWYGHVYITTEDGSYGEKGYVTQHSLLNRLSFDRIYTCGPKPMMKAVGEYAKINNVFCEVSLENTMACGIGACLCCVENTTEGHLRVCKEGPVFNRCKLLW
ncbi:Dihydroorotate dehydrogenase B (NAD(+)) electron transfer subunit [termite gut metagenome]|uniref:Dihydroorotate dehydrogenase B (NAD(+)) electron transfer subunit n=1 Tax=termite gut metagenome TaxID=433724 RepID=A0A5J4SIU2_9ZZZZ